jgi:hypothetical protein
VFEMTAPIQSPALTFLTRLVNQLYETATLSLSAYLYKCKERNVPLRNTVHSVNFLPPLLSKLPLKHLEFQLPLTTRSEHGTAWKTLLCNFINILISTFQIWAVQIAS